MFFTKHFITKEYHTATCFSLQMVLKALQPRIFLGLALQDII